MIKYRISTPIWLSSKRCKLLVNHILLTIYFGKKDYRFQGITYFDNDEWDDIRKQVIKKINQCPKVEEGNINILYYYVKD